MPSRAMLGLARRLGLFGSGDGGDEDTSLSFRGMSFGSGREFARYVAGHLQSFSRGEEERLRRGSIGSTESVHREARPPGSASTESVHRETRPPGSASPRYSSERSGGPPWSPDPPPRRADSRTNTTAFACVGSHTTLFPSTEKGKQMKGRMMSSMSK